MLPRIHPYEEAHAAGCAELIAALPDWFGLPESNAAYLRDLARLPSWVCIDADTVIAAGTLAPHFDDAFEVHFMAVRPERHRGGVGRSLLEHLEAEARSRGGRWMHIKTLAASSPDPHYARTRAFYLAMGYAALFESDRLFDPNNPAVVLVKRL